jgi:hypothetical protein
MTARVIMALTPTEFLHSMLLDVHSQRPCWPWPPGRCPDGNTRHVARSVVRPLSQSPLDAPWSCGGLRSAPDCRTRRAFLHLSYSCAAPSGPALLRDTRPKPDLDRISRCARENPKETNRIESASHCRRTGKDIASAELPTGTCRRPLIQIFFLVAAFMPSAGNAP